MKKHLRCSIYNLVLHADQLALIEWYVVAAVPHTRQSDEVPHLKNFTPS